VCMVPLVEPQVSRTVSLVTVSGRRQSPATMRLVRAAMVYAWPGRSNGDVRQIDYYRTKENHIPGSHQSYCAVPAFNTSIDVPHRLM